MTKVFPLFGAQGSVLGQIGCAIGTGLAVPCDMPQVTTLYCFSVALGFGEQRLVMLNDDDASSSSLSFEAEAVTEPPFCGRPAGADVDGCMDLLGLQSNAGIHFSSRSTTMVQQLRCGANRKSGEQRTRN